MRALGALADEEDVSGVPLFDPEDRGTGAKIKVMAEEVTPDVVCCDEGRLGRGGTSRCGGLDVVLRTGVVGAEDGNVGERCPAGAT